MGGFVETDTIQNDASKLACMVEWNNYESGGENTLSNFEEKIYSKY